MGERIRMKWSTSFPKNSKSTNENVSNILENTNKTCKDLNVGSERKRFFKNDIA